MEQPEYFNFLYVIDNSFFCFMNKLNKKEKLLLNAKLIWKRNEKK
jgi:hypothetical protein